MAACYCNMKKNTFFSPSPFVLSPCTFQGSWLWPFSQVFRKSCHLPNKMRHLKINVNPLCTEGTFGTHSKLLCKFSFKILQFQWQIYIHQYQQHWCKKHWQSVRKHLTVAAGTDCDPVVFCLFFPPHTPTGAHRLNSGLASSNCCKIGHIEVNLHSQGYVFLLLDRLDWSSSGSCSHQC